MKTILKMLLLPVGVFVLASAGAVTTKTEKDNAAKKPNTLEYIWNPSSSSCAQRSVNCTTVNTGNFCMADSDTHQVYRKSAGICDVLLYKVD